MHYGFLDFQHRLIMELVSIVLILEESKTEALSLTVIFPKAFSNGGKVSKPILMANKLN
jgi:hypothetical protein